VPRAPTTLDPFNAIAEPRRRRVLDTLAHGEMPVNGIVHTLGWPQPMISKHLGVLKEVGLVIMRRQGRQCLYRVNGGQLKPIYDWAKTFERFWTHQLERIRQRAERTARQRAVDQPDPKISHKEK
jgi:DNA-binding transcriptional ArsR family regulator